MECSDSVDEEVTSLSDAEQNESLRQTSVRSLLKITTLQGQLGQIRISLARKEKDLEVYRRKAKNELMIGRSLGVQHMSQNAVKDIVTFITLLEEQNRDLRALSSIPIEIEKLKAELPGLSRLKKSFASDQRSYPNSETSSGMRLTLSQIPSEVSQMRLELAEMQGKLAEEAEARTHLEEIVVPSLKQAKTNLERELARLRSETSPHKPREEVSLVSFQDNEQFNKGEEPRCVTPASPASRSLMQAKGSLSARATTSNGGGGDKRPKKGYAPTFLRVLKGKRQPKIKGRTPTPEPPTLISKIAVTDSTPAKSHPK